MEDFVLHAGDGAPGDQFGWSVAIDGRLIAVGAWHDADNGSNAGSVYLYHAITGEQRAKLLASDGDADDVFGVSLDLKNGLVAVGARDNDDSGSNSGAAYVFDASCGVEIAKLVADDAAAGDRFGRAVAIGDGVVCVGSPLDDAMGTDSGSVYVFDAQSGEQLMKIVPEDGAAGDRFGFALSIDDGVLAACAYHDDVHGANSGSVYLFDLSTEEQLLKIAPEDGEADDVFGRSVSIDDGVLAVGADTNDLGTNAGGVYLFDTIDGSQITKLLAHDGALGDTFGAWVRVDGGRVVVGAPFHSDGVFGTGGAYVYDASTGVLVDRLVQQDAASGSFLGTSVDISIGQVVAGAVGVGGAGAVSVYRVGCQADLSGDYTLGFFDVSMFINAYIAGELVADFNGDGQLNFFDISLFLGLYQQGCR